MSSKPIETINFDEMGKYLKKVKWDKEDLEHARRFIKQISGLSEENFLGYDVKGLKELEYIMSNNEKILVPAFGQYSSGKSSLLNILIGEDYLPTSEGVCTNKGVIIEYTSNVDTVELYEAKIKFETEFSKFFVIEKKKLISNDRTKIKSEIDKINRQHKSIQFEDSFLLLRVHIEFFELFEKEEREKILLIDFPGLGVLQKNNFFNSEVLGPLINQSDSFLFFNHEVINSDENQKIIINIVEKIRNRKISFSYNNCLFIMNKWDNHRKDNSTYTLDEAKKELEQIFSNNQLSDIFSDIDIINCSAKDYNAFLSKKKNIIDFDKYFDTLKSNFEDFYKEEEDEEDEEREDDCKEDSDKNEAFYKYIDEDLKKKIKELIDAPSQNNEEYENNRGNYIQRLNNFLKKNNYDFKDIYINEIVKSYLYLISNINNHKLMILSNKKKLDEKIKSHLKSSLFNLDNNIKSKGINFLLNINDTLSFVLKKLNPSEEEKQKNDFKISYSKIDASKKIEKDINERFIQHKGLINFAIQKNINDQNNLINNYINKLHETFVKRKKENENLKNRDILGQIEKEYLNILKENKKDFYRSMEKDFQNFIEEVKTIIKDIKCNLEIGEENFRQVYFETSDVNANRVSKDFKSSFFSVLKKITDLIHATNWSEYILHKYILYDDEETIINKSIENFNLVRRQNQENMRDYLKVYNEKLEDFEVEVKSEVQKMIDLSYSDYTQFQKYSTEIIKKSSQEFNDYIKNKYKEN